VADLWELEENADLWELEEDTFLWELEEDIIVDAPMPFVGGGYYPEQG
jgi:hypothetical protein